MMNRVKRRLEHIVRKLGMRVEQRLLQKPLSNKFPPIFIVGMPRSGTTVFFQSVLARFDLCYFSNKERKNNRFPTITAYRNKSANRFQPAFSSSYGNINGTDAPSDGWEIFHRWFSYFFNPEKTKQNKLQELKTTIAHLEKIYDRPFAVKNNANTLRIEELHQSFPEAIYINVHREIYSCIASVLKGREKNKVAVKNFWSAAPEWELIDQKLESELEMVVYQYVFVEEYLKRVRKREGINFLDINYGEFCKKPTACLDKLKDLYGADLKERGLSLDFEQLVSPKNKTQEIEFMEKVDLLQNRYQPLVERLFDRKGWCKNEHHA